MLVERSSYQPNPLKYSPLKYLPLVSGDLEFQIAFLRKGEVEISSLSGRSGNKRGIIISKNSLDGGDTIA